MVIFILSKKSDPRKSNHKLGFRNNLQYYIRDFGSIQGNVIRYKSESKLLVVFTFSKKI